MGNPCVPEFELSNENEIELELIASVFLGVPSQFFCFPH